MESESKEIVKVEIPRVELREVNLDIINDPVLEHVENFIKLVDSNISALILIQGIALVKLEREGLWTQAGYTSLEAYRRDMGQRVNMPKQTLSARRKVGEAWFTYQTDLRTLQMDGHVSKLRYLLPAMTRHKNKKLVLEHFKADSYRDFVEFAIPPMEDIEYPDVEIRFNRDVFSVDGSKLIQINPEADETEKEFIVSVLKASYKARTGGRYPHVVSVYDSGEARAVENFIKKYRAKK